MKKTEQVFRNLWDTIYLINTSLKEGPEENIRRVPRRYLKK